MNDTDSRPMPVQSAQDAAGPGEADYAGIVDELRRLRDEADEAGKAYVGFTKDASATKQAYHEGRAVAYGKALALLSGAELPQPQPGSARK